MIWSTLKICTITYVDVGDEVCCWQVTFMWWWWQVISKSVTGWSYCWSPTTVSNTHRVHSLRTNWLRRVEIVSLTRVRLTTVAVYKVRGHKFFGSVAYQSFINYTILSDQHLKRYNFHFSHSSHALLKIRRLSSPHISYAVHKQYNKSPETIMSTQNAQFMITFIHSIFLSKLFILHSEPFSR